MNIFTCDKCKETFNKVLTDEEAEKEYSIAFWTVSGADRRVLCDDCFNDFKKWFALLTPEQHSKIRENVE